MNPETNEDLKSRSAPTAPPPTEPQHTAPPTGLWHGVPARVLAHVIAHGILWTAGGILFLIGSSKAWHQTVATKGKIDVHLVLSGNIPPGANVELHPVETLARLDSDGQKWFRGVEFSTVQNSDLEVRLLDGVTRTTIATVPIGERPLIHIQREVK